MAALDEFRERWIAANESNDPNAFAGGIDKINEVRDIVAQVTGDPEAAVLAVKVIMRCLELR